MKRFLVVLFVVTFLAACGGTPAATVVEPTALPAAEPTEEAPAVAADGEIELEADMEAEPEQLEEAEDEADTGIDRATGLSLNPPDFAPGMEFVVRGRIISMTLIPQTRPEFLIEAPSGRRYRMNAQPLSEIFYDDGRQLRAHEYRQGMRAQATVSLPANATRSDVLSTTNFTLLSDN